MSSYDYLRTGKKSDQEPTFRPFARGMFMLYRNNPEHEPEDDDYIKMNLLAQKELSALSPDFARAQQHWSTLPHTPARQLENRFYSADSIDGDIDEERKWIDYYASMDSLVSIFSIELEIDLRTGEKRKPFPVIGFSFGRGIETMDDMFDKHCIKYRIRFAYAE